MRCYDPKDEDNIRDAEDAKAEPWMLRCLAMNPEYPFWGPHEDYMAKRGDGWEAPVTTASWKALELKLDDYNEVANFYFAVYRDSEDCASCDHTGYNAATREIADTFYDLGDFSLDFTNWTTSGSAENARREGGATGRRWSDKVTQDEVDALVAAGRLRQLDPGTREWKSVPRTAAEVNAANARGGMGDLRHDGINRHILIEARAKRLGVHGLCDACEGRGYRYTADWARLAITLWVLHPRKGASRGWEIENVERGDLPDVLAFLREAAARNAERFSKVPVGGCGDEVAF